MEPTDLNQPATVRTVILNHDEEDHFHFNDVLAVLDANGVDTGGRVFFVGYVVDAQGEYTDEAHVVATKRGGGFNLPLKRLVKADPHSKKATNGDKTFIQLALL